MGESTDRIRFINSHDYVGDLDDRPVAGCLASLRTEGDTNVVLYMRSLRLRHTLEMVYAATCVVTVDYSEEDTTRRSAIARNAGDGPRTGAQLREAVPAQGGRVDL